MPLSREEVVAGALALLDDVGLDALTMRRLAQALEVQAGAIYWHFADRQELEDAMVDAMLDGLLEPAPKGRWDERLAELCRRMAAALLEHRDGARLATRTLRPGPNGLALSEAMFAILVESGRSQRAALWAASVVGYYVLGYVTDLQATEAAKARGLMSVVRSLKKELDREQYPFLASISEQRMAQLMTGREAHARFEFGLDVILRGLQRAKLPSSRGRRRR